MLLQLLPQPRAGIGAELAAVGQRLIAGAAMPGIRREAGDALSPGGPKALLRSQPARRAVIDTLRDKTRHGLVICVFFHDTATTEKIVRTAPTGDVQMELPHAI